MKYVCVLIVLLFSVVDARAQNVKHYLVFTFQQQWKSDKLSWNTGDYLWIVPYDSCGSTSFVKDVVPLFAEEFQLNCLYDEETNNSDYGQWPITREDYKQPIIRLLRKNRKLIQVIHSCHPHIKSSRTLKVYLTPISAQCLVRYLGYKKREVLVLESNPSIWKEFWSLPEKEIKNILSYDFSTYDYVVRN